MHLKILNLRLETQDKQITPKNKFKILKLTITLTNCSLMKRLTKMQFSACENVRKIFTIKIEKRKSNNNY